MEMQGFKSFIPSEKLEKLTGELFHEMHECIQPVAIQIYESEKN